MKYFKRVITFDPATENFKVSVPSLGIEVLSDTEMGGILEARKEVEAHAKKQRELPPDAFVSPEPGPECITVEKLKQLREQIADSLVMPKREIYGRWPPKYEPVYTPIFYDPGELKKRKDD